MKLFKFQPTAEMYKCAHLMKSIGIPVEKREEYFSHEYNCLAKLLGTTSDLTDLVKKQVGKSAKEAMKNIEETFKENDNLRNELAIRNLNQDYSLIL